MKNNMSTRSWQAHKTTEKKVVPSKYRIDINKAKRLSNNTVVYRIFALQDFGDVKAGDRGGFIQNSRNLSHEGDCWVYDDSIIFEGARIGGITKIKNNSLIGGAVLLHQGLFSNCEIRAAIPTRNISYMENAKIKSNRDIWFYIRDVETVVYKTKDGSRLLKKDGIFYSYDEILIAGDLIDVNSLYSTGYGLIRDFPQNRGKPFEEWV